MREKVTIDRFEGQFAVCETDERVMLDIPKCEIPNDAKEGDILIRDTKDEPWQIAEEETASRRKEMQDRLNRLFGD